jgi:hypothetical protein
MGVANCSVGCCLGVSTGFPTFIVPCPPVLFLSLLPVDSSSRRKRSLVELVGRGSTDSPICIASDVVGVEGVEHGLCDTPLGGGDSEGEGERGMRGQGPGVLDITPSPPHSPRSSLTPSFCTKSQGFRLYAHSVGFDRERARARDLSRSQSRSLFLSLFPCSSLFLARPP